MENSNAPLMMIVKNRYSNHYKNVTNKLLIDFMAWQKYLMLIRSHGIRWKLVVRRIRINLKY